MTLVDCWSDEFAIIADARWWGRSRSTRSCRRSARDCESHLLFSAQPFRTSSHKRRQFENVDLRCTPWPDVLRAGGTWSWNDRRWRAPSKTWCYGRPRNRREFCRRIRAIEDDQVEIRWQLLFIFHRRHHLRIAQVHVEGAGT